MKVRFDLIWMDFLKRVVSKASKLRESSNKVGYYYQ